MAWTTPGTATAGEVLTAAFWNTNVRDNSNEFASFFAAWTSYTPTIKQGVTLTKTTTYAKYVQIGKIVWGNVRLDITSAGTAGQQIRVELPIAIANTGGLCSASGRYWNGSQVYVLAGAGASEGRFINFDSQGGASGFGINPAVTAANGHFLDIMFHYETT